MADLVTLQTRLLEAELALHKIVTQQAVVKVRISDQLETTYTAASADDLRKHIAELKSDIAALGGGGLKMKALSVDL